MKNSIKIISDDNANCYLQISLNDPSDPYSNYHLSFSYQDGHSEFGGGNRSIHFSEATSFLEKFKAFVNADLQQIRLEATEGSYLLFERLSVKQEAYVRFQIATFLQGAKQPVYVSGQFPIQHSLYSILSQFQILFS